MKQLLTPEEKKQLKFVSNYLRSHGLREGYVEFEMDYDDENLPTVESVNWKYVSHFSNSYNVEIPDVLVKIIRKVLGAAQEFAHLNTDYENLSSQRLEIRIDAVKREISMIHDVFYYDRGDVYEISFDSDQDKERFDRWMETSLAETEVPNDGILTVPYNGSGDSGWIESSFEPTNSAVPADIEHWMYEELERHCGGWEINEGSDGTFVFDFNQSVVHLEHTYNTEERQSDTIWEESFAD